MRGNKTRRELGALGEQLAAGHLIAKGYSVLARNVHVGHKEIDIIARREQYLVFVEVKLRRAGGLVSGLEAVGHRKQQHLLAAAEAYIHQQDLYHLQPRFDVIEVQTDGNGTPLRIHHLEDAYS